MSPARQRALYLTVIGAAAALWLAAVAATGLALGGPGPPRALAWAGMDPTPPDERGLPELLVLGRDAAWSIAQRPLPGDGATLDVAYLDLPTGVARRDWPLPASCRVADAYLHVRGFAHAPDSGDLWLALAPSTGAPWLCAVHLRAAGGVVDLGRAGAATDVLATSRRGDGLGVVNGACEEVRFSPGAAPTVARLAGCPEPAPLTRVLTGAPEGDGWRVTWERRTRDEGVVRWTRGPAGRIERLAADEAAFAVDRVPRGGLGFSTSFSIYQEPVPTPAAGVPAAMTRRFAHDVVRSDAHGLRRAVLYGGFWSWCLELPDRDAAGALCIDHDPLDHVATWTGPTGTVADDVVTPRWDPADPVLLPASAGGAWLLDRSHTALDGRVYLRLDPTTLERLDPMSGLERLGRAQPRTPADLDALMATGGPHGAALPSDPAQVPGVLLRATIALPLGLLAFPALLVLGVGVQRARRRRPLLASAPVAIGAGLYLALALVQGGRFATLLSWL